MANNFNFFPGGNDPLLDPSYMDSQIEKMIELRNDMRRRQQQLAQNRQAEPEPQQQQKTPWDEIAEEMDQMSDEQKRMLFEDEEYQAHDQHIAAIAARYQMAVLIPYVLKDEEGRKAIEAQLHTIRAKKDIFAAREREEMEEFAKWKESRKNNKKQQ